jgi:hypothetical protein
LVFIYLALSNLSSFSVLMSGDYGEPFWPTWFLMQTGLHRSPILLWVGLLGLIATPIIWVHSKIAHICSAIGILVVASLNEKIGHSGHQTHPWVLVAITFAVLLPSCNQASIRTYNYKLIRAVVSARAVFLSVYFLSGMNKVMGYFACDSGSCAPLTQWLDWSIGSQYFKTGHFGNLANFVYDSPTMNLVGIVLVIASQLLLIFVNFHSRAPLLIGIWILAFHYSTKLILDIGFWRTALCGLVLFIAAEFYQFTSKDPLRRS